MKRFLSFLALSLTLFSPLALAEEEAAEGTVIELSPEYMRLLRDAGIEFQRRNFDEALKILDQADAITLATPIALNLRGAVFTEKRDFEKADEFFRRALEQAPQYFAPQFNRGEVLFLQKKYPQARDHFIQMLDTYKDNELLQYKISLSYLVEDNMEKALEWRDRIKFPSDSPAYYFAHAAVSFKEENAADAVEWIASSERIFGAENNLLFLESLADLGYIQRPAAAPQDGETAPPASTPLPSAGAGARGN